jgi:uncharacterized membrane protein
MKERKIPGLFASYFEERGASYRELLIFVMQLSLIVSFLFAFLNSFFLNWVNIAAVSLFSLITFYVLLSNFKALEKKEDFPAYLYFFGIMQVLAFILAIHRLFISGLDFGFIMVYIAILLLSVGFFYVMYRRDSTEATVLAASKDWAAVHVHYDLRACPKVGYFAVRTKGIKLKQGDKIRVKVKRLLGEGTKPWEALEKI